MKVVIPVAGLGTRLLPATKAIPKEMIPVVDKPLIQYVVKEAVDAGATEIILVTHSSKNSIENHFDTSFELEATLQNRVKRQLLKDVQDICPKNVKVISVRQGTPKGSGHAILCALPVVGDDDFAVILPDVLVDSIGEESNLKQMFANFKQSGSSQILVEKVQQNLISQYGIVDVGADTIIPGDIARIKNVVEKPLPEDAPSDLAIVGRYVLSRDIWNLLKKTPTSDSGEIELTDAIEMHIEAGGSVNAYCLKGESHDCGSKIGLAKANIIYGLRHPEIGKELADFISQLKNT